MIKRESKVLDILPENGQPHILRAVDGTTAGVHTNTAILYEDPRRFMFNTGVGIQTITSFNINSEFYFDPVNVVGTGTARGVGIGTTITFTDVVSTGIHKHLFLHKIYTLKNMISN